MGQVTIPLSGPECAIAAQDSRLAERITRALRQTGYTALGEIKVAIHRRDVRLSGQISTYYLKQIAQTTILGIPGVQHIDNDLEVSRLK
jgi:osmotically-inducible protein OsmY